MESIFCKDNSGFEDQLTAEKWYKVAYFNNSEVCIINDNGDTKWYGMMKFEINPT